MVPALTTPVLMVTAFTTPLRYSNGSRFNDSRSGDFYSPSIGIKFLALSPKLAFCLSRYTSNSWGLFKVEQRNMI